MSDSISVVEVIQASGYAYSKKLAWAAGREVSKAWRREHGGAPDYAMRPKTLDGSSATHLKAIYPSHWRGKIEEIIDGVARKIEAVAVSQDPRATIEQGSALALWAREALSGNPQKLVWHVDLRKDVGEPDAVGDPDGYNDRRWTETIKRLHNSLQRLEGHPNTVTTFGFIVVCLVGCEEGETPRPVSVELSVPHLVDAGVMLSRRPPVGRWFIMSDQEVGLMTKDRSTPDTYFIDGIPF